MAIKKKKGPSLLEMVKAEVDARSQQYQASPEGKYKLAQQEKQKEKENLNTLLNSNGVVTGNGLYSAPNMFSVRENQRKQLKENPLSFPIKNQFKTQKQLVEEELDNIKKYNQLMEQGDIKEQTKKLNEARSKTALAKYDYLQDKISKDNTTFIDRLLSPVRGATSFLLKEDEMYQNENGDWVSIPSQSELKQQKVLEDTDNFIGKVLVGAGYEGGKIGIATLMNTIAPGSGAFAYNTNIFMDSYNQTLREGYSQNEALGLAAATVGIEYVTGTFLGGLANQTTFAGTDSELSTTISNVLKDAIKNPRINSMIANGLSEGTEEFLQEFIDKFSRNLILNEDNKITKETLKDAIYSGLVGMTTGAANGGISPNPEIVNYSNMNKDINGTISEEETKLGRSLTKTEINDIKYKASLDYNLPFVKDKKETQQRIINSQPKIQQFRESTNQYPNKNITEDFKSVVEKVIKDKGYNIVMDDTIKDSNGNQVDGKINTLPNDEVEIRLNPNSKRAGEFLLTHEITHAIGTESMIKIVEKYAENHPEFQKYVNEVNEAYKTEEKANVMEETLSNIAGQMFGNQEFISKLSVEEPSLFKQAKDLVLSTLNKINGGKNKSLFEKTLKSKWQINYATQDNNVGNESYLKRITKDGAKYTELDGKLFKNSDGTAKTPREMYNSIVGQTLTLDDGSKVKLVKKLPGNKDIYDEFIKRRAKSKNVIDVATLNTKINGNIDEILEQSDFIETKPDVNGRHSKNGIINFDTREAKIYDGNQAYNLTLSIAELNNGEKVGYAKKYLTPDEKLTNTIKKELTTGSTSDIGRSSRMSTDENTLSQNNDKVKSSNNNSMQKRNNNTQELENSSFFNTKYSVSEDISSDNQLVQDAEDVTNYKTNYENVPDNLLGFRKQGQNKGFYEEKYKYSLDLLISVDGGKTYFEDAIKGLNRNQAIERAKRNWPNATDIRIKNTNIKDLTNANVLKEKQLNIINKTNPVEDDYHTWIRNIDDIKTLEETIKDSDWADVDKYDPDLTKQDILNAIDSGKITVYSSYPIEQGTFVSPSKMEAESYSGTGKVYSKQVNINDVAWIDPTQGQYANVNEKYSKSTSKEQQMLEKQFPNNNTRTFFNEIAPIREDIKSLNKAIDNLSSKMETTQNQVENSAREDIAPIKGDINNDFNKFQTANNKIDRRTFKNITDSLEKHPTHNAKIFQDEKMKRKSGLNKEPKIVNIDNIFEGVEKNNVKLFRKSAIEKAMSLFRDKIVNIKDIDTDVELKRKGLRETFSKELTPAKIDSANNLFEIIEEGIYAYSTKNTDSEVFHHFYSPVNYNGKNEIFRVVVKENLNEKTNRFHFHLLESTQELLQNKNGTSPTPQINEKVGSDVPLSNSDDTTKNSKSQIAPSPNNMKQNVKNDTIISTKDDIAPIKSTSKAKNQSSFYGNITEESKYLNEDLRKEISLNDSVKYYDTITNEDTMNKAKNKIRKGGQTEINSWFAKDSKNATAEDVAEGWILMKYFQDNNQYDDVVEVAKKMRTIGTSAGQTIQAFNILNRLTPEGMVKYAVSELQEAKENLSKNKSKQWIDEHSKNFELTPEETEFIINKMEELNNMDTEYGKRVVLGEVQKVITDKLPSTAGNKIKAWMRIAMLFNPKTQVRNVAGNAIIAPINYFGDMFASTADKLISKKTGVRTTGNMNVKSILKGIKEGLTEATTDYKKGINTKNMEGNRFEIAEGKSFSDKNIIGRNLNRTESLLNYVMDVGDRLFSKASFENSINNQMKLNNSNKVTQEMIDIATQESLSRTWNDNNNYTEFVLGIRRRVNKIGIKGYGLGDILIPFAKTPANLTKAIVDYSPAGFITALVDGNNLRKSLDNGQFNAKMQHKFVQDLGKATAGTALYILGYALANTGVISGEDDDDKDAKSFMKNVLGINSYSIKIGDKSFTYDWAQPIAAPLSITANVVNSQKSKETALLEGIINSLDTGSSILLEQSFMQSLNDVLNDNDGVVSGLVNEILELPSRAIPTFSKQIADLTDGTQRSTYVYKSPLETAKNKIKSKIPGLSNTLAPVVNTMGEEVQKYGGKNNIFNVFFNPANINAENLNENGSEIYRVYQSTNDKTILPRMIPYYINKNGEKIVLDSNQRVEFQKISGKTIDESMGKLLENDTYLRMSDTDKAAIINDIVNYSYNIAQKEVLDTDISSTYEKAYEYSKIGNISDFYTFKNSIDETNSNTKKDSITSYLINCDLNDEQIGNLYVSYYSSKKRIDSILNANIPMKEFIKFNYEDFEADYNSNGNIETNSRKNKIINYVNKLNLSLPQRAMLIKTKYSSFKNYDSQIVSYVNKMDYSKYKKASLLKQFGFDDYDDYIVSYVNNLNISKKEKIDKLKDLGFAVRNGKVYY